MAIFFAFSKAICLHVLQYKANENIMYPNDPRKETLWIGQFCEIWWWNYSSS